MHGYARCRPEIGNAQGSCTSKCSSFVAMLHTPLILRTSSLPDAKIFTIPDGLDSEPFYFEKLHNFDGLPDLIESAKATMGIPTMGNGFSKDILQIEISGPNYPHLTIVDLPGLIHSETKQQGASAVTLVKDVVKEYMEKKRSIVLAVVSAKNDFASQIVLKLAQSADPEGKHTLGVITKPDRLVPNSRSEAMFMSLPRNEEVEFQLGGHILKNLGSEKELRVRLRDLLLRQIATELSSLIKEIDSKVSDCQTAFHVLGNPGITVEEQRSCLLQISQRFQVLLKAALDGTCNDSFFEHVKSERGRNQHLRAVVQNLNQDSAKKLKQFGHKQTIVDTEMDTKSQSTIMRQIRGCGLPGLFNSAVVTVLFREQSAPWKQIVPNHMGSVWEAVKRFLQIPITSIAGEDVSKCVLSKIINTALATLRHFIDAKAIELVESQITIHPEVTKIIENISGTTIRKMKNFCDEFGSTELIDRLSTLAEPDIERNVASKALDCI
ncbi:P-loop containing nucleoside triphosphate hydrolase protein [Xylaria nigripes]|nr:P-loop containing nucleoside triphosphate hydrolase protein [Xylaria nigripes]